MVYQWRTAGDMPPTTSQYSADTRSSAGEGGELEVRCAKHLILQMLCLKIFY